MIYWFVLTRLLILWQRQVMMEKLSFGMPLMKLMLDIYVSVVRKIQFDVAQTPSRCSNREKFGNLKRNPIGYNEHYSFADPTLN